MHFSLLYLMAASLSLISWAFGEGIVNREYLPAIGTQRFIHTHYPSYYQQIQQNYPPYNSGGYYPHYSNGLLGGPTSSVGLGSSSGIGGGYYPNLNFALINQYRPKPRVDVIDTIYDANGGYIYGKKK
ncbi:hypothetical protein CVS40_9686 [Lucilia cuprina]|nr:hypothetical protein CVS40_9686 [Lucilia cuprina]